MYDFLLKYFNRNVSTVITAAWYLLLILLILYLMFAPEGKLRYLDY